MKDPFCVFVISVLFVTTNVRNNSINSCEGMTKHGPLVFVDFFQINRPCNCIVTPSFASEMLVISREVAVQMCNTEINVQKRVVFRCTMNMIASQILNVNINQTVDVRADYISPYTSGKFYHCMGFLQNEQCLQSDESSTITSCEGSTKYGSNIYIDFYKINSTCTCTVSPSFAGELLVISTKEIHICFTKVYVNYNENRVIFGCQSDQVSSHVFNVLINESMEVRAEDESSSSSGTFFYCLGFKQNGGSNGNLSVMCGSPPETATTTVSSTISTNTLTSLQISHASSPFEPSIETTTTPTSTLSSGTINVSYGSLSMESTTDNPEMLYIIAGSAGGGAIILVGLIVVILVLIKRSRSARNKNGCTEADMARTNEVFDSNPELPDNPLYLSSQPMDELGYSSDQEKQLGLPPTDSKTKKNINSDYDVPPNNKPIDNSASLMPVYAVPKMANDRTPNVSTGDVYAEVCKPDRSTEQAPVRNRNEDGLLYMEVEQDTAATKQTNTNDKNEITEGVCYAEIKRT